VAISCLASVSLALSHWVRNASRVSSFGQPNQALSPLVPADVIGDATGLIAIYLAVKMITKFLGILPLTRIFRFEHKDGTRGSSSKRAG
jgi:hypothetical protein